MSTFTDEQIASVCHAANAQLCIVTDDFSQVPWEYAPEWQRESAIKGVRFAIENPDASDSAQHDAWMDAKLADGWSYGESKDPRHKTHPCLVPFDRLPPEQRAKDTLFRAVVRALTA